MRFVSIHALETLENMGHLAFRVPFPLWSPQTREKQAITMVRIALQKLGMLKLDFGLVGAPLKTKGASHDDVCKQSISRNLLADAAIDAQSF